MMEDFNYMKNVKAIFLDMDGTILHKDNRVDKETTEIIQTLRNHGYKVFLATGRAHDEIHYLVPENFKVAGSISSNGTNGVVHHETMFKHTLTFDTANEIVKRAKAQAVYYVVCPCDGNRTILNGDQAWAEAMFNLSTPPENVGYSEWTSSRAPIVDKVSFKTSIPVTSF